MSPSGNDAAREAARSDDGKFGTQPHGRPTKSLAQFEELPTERSDRFGGYRLGKVQTMQGREGQAFSAELTKDGKVVAYVRNDGYGGCNFYDTTDREALSEFTAFAKSNKGEDAFEPDDQFIDDILIARDISRMRNLAFVIDGDDFYGKGEHRAFRGTSREDAIAELKKPQYADKNPKVWDKDRLDFVPVDEA